MGQRKNLKTGTKRKTNDKYGKTVVRADTRPANGTGRSETRRQATGQCACLGVSSPYDCLARFVGRDGRSHQCGYAEHRGGLHVCNLTDAAAAIDQARPATPQEVVHARVEA